MTEIDTEKHKKRTRLLPVTMVALALQLGFSTVATAQAAIDGEALYQENCASCHGAGLQGQPNWKQRGDDGLMPAPPHDETGHTWHHADALLFQLTKEGVAAMVGGGYQSAMPPFADVLSDAEIQATLDYIKSTWSKRERDIQAEITEAAVAASQ